MIISGGVYPTMLIAYNKDGTIDSEAVSALLDWYENRGIDGIFALCHSTESHWLTLAEKRQMLSIVNKKYRGRLPVVASGITSRSLDVQLYEAMSIVDEGADAIVFIRNSLGATEDDFKRSVERILKNVPDNIPLGIYECPYPYKQYLSDQEFSFIVSTKRFRFIKDTVCDINVMKRREAIRTKGDPEFRLFNANCASLLNSLRFGYDGFCGIMANFHPELYAWLTKNIDHPLADQISYYLGMMSVIEMRSYPICAKQYLNRYENIPMTDICRSAVPLNTQTVYYELEDIHELTKMALNLIIH